MVRKDSMMGEPPEARLLDGIQRRPSLKREYGHVEGFAETRPSRAATPAPRAQSRPDMPSQPPDVLAGRMADTLLLAYVALRGHLHAPGKVGLKALLEEIGATLAETGTLLNWLPWEGGECPLPPSVEVEIMWSDGGKQIAAAGEIAWVVPETVGLVDLPEDLRFVMFYRVVRW